MNKIRMGIIGLGKRGYCNLSHYLAKYTDVEICVLCDLYEDRIEKAAQTVKKLPSVPTSKKKKSCRI